MRWLALTAGLLVLPCCGTAMSAEDLCAAGCDGCCRGGICYSGDSPEKCGTGGALCETCGNGQTCSAARACASPPAQPAPCTLTPDLVKCSELGCGNFFINECNQSRTVNCGACSATGGGGGGGGGGSSGGTGGGGSSSGGCHVDCSAFGLSCCGSTCC